MADDTHDLEAALMSESWRGKPWLTTAAAVLTAMAVVGILIYASAKGVLCLQSSLASAFQPSEMKTDSGCFPVESCELAPAPLPGDAEFSADTYRIMHGQAFQRNLDDLRGDGRGSDAEALLLRDESAGKALLKFKSLYDDEKDTAFNE